MKWFRVEYKLAGWSATQWQADTIFGHICWGMLFKMGEKRLGEFLGAYIDDKPPCLLSNGFPSGFMPAPLISPPYIDDNLPLTQQIEQFRNYKVKRNNKLVPIDVFEHAINGDPAPYISPTQYQQVRVNLKNQVNRRSGTTGSEGSLFNFEEFSIDNIQIYVKATDEYADLILDLFEYIAQTGYGKRKSAGYGSIQNMTIKEFTGFGTGTKCNGFITLSNFIPAKHDPIVGRWSTLVKYGKLGEAYAVDGNAFKRPLVMLEAGSVFYDQPCREYYGCMATMLNDEHPQVYQYAYALPVPAILPP